ncbi:MAG: hypothetical protein L0271_25295 [Gemmatimonadetes bacterium]|nr:hypothetical protein [Gemmatimonadota bacterium]
MLLVTSAPGTTTSSAPEWRGLDGGGESDAGGRELPFFYDLYTFRGDTATTVVATFAVEAGRLESEQVENGVRYRFDVSLILADTARRTVTSTHDSVYLELARPLPSDHLLYTAVEVQAPASGKAFQRVIMFNATAPGIGQLYSTDFPIPDYTGADLMLSDIALGQPDVDVGWKLGDLTFAIMPAGRIPSSAFDAYYEIYNLPAGNPYATVISVDRVDEAGVALARVVDLRFEGESTAGRDAVLPERRRIESSLARGRYRITATVTDLFSGRTATQSRTFEIRFTRGTTMVPAFTVASGQSSLSR